MIQLNRIAAMEAAFDRACASMIAGRPNEDALRTLSAYMDSGEWLQDYEADEAGLLPRDMQRGVLSQDALYNLLTEWKDRK